MNMNEIRTDACEETTTCFNCGSSGIEKTWRRQSFQYGNGASAVELTAEMPVYSCAECGFEFVGAEAEDVRHEAVCRHLGLLTPSEIVAIREANQLTRVQFAEVTRIGIASLKRWETGALIPHAANDALVYLMTFPENLKRLQSRNHFDPLDIADISASVELPPRHRSVIPFRGRGITADSISIERAASWALRV